MRVIHLLVLGKQVVKLVFEKFNNVLRNNKGWKKINRDQPTINREEKSTKLWQKTI